MFKSCCVLGISLGAIIMMYSIMKYYKTVKLANAASKRIHTSSIRSYNFSLGLMCFFLLGYMCTGVFIILSTQLGLGDAVISAVYLFGAIFVYIMIKAQQQMVSLQAKDVLGTVTDNIYNMIYVVNPETYEILFINKACAQNANKNTTDLIGKTCWKALKKNLKGPCAQCPATIVMDKNHKEGAPHYWEYREDNFQRTYFVTSTSITWIDNRRALLCNMMDVSDRKQYEETLQNCAMRDKLTGAFNRTWGHQLLDRMFRPGHDLVLPMVFCFFDLDGLKEVNDAYGHNAGDKLLCRFVECIKKNVRKEDVLIRWGGDEFVLILHCDMTHVHNILQKIDSEITFENQKMANTGQHMRYSYGVEEVTNYSNTMWEVYISKADAKMYAQKISKGAGRKTIP